MGADEFLKQPWERGLFEIPVEALRRDGVCCRPFRWMQPRFDGVSREIVDSRVGELAVSERPFKFARVSEGVDWVEQRSRALADLARSHPLGEKVRSQEGPVVC